MDISSEEQTDYPILFVSDPKRHDFYRFSHLSGNTPFEPLFSPFPEKSPAQCPSHKQKSSPDVENRPKSQHASEWTWPSGNSLTHGDHKLP